MKQIEKQFPKYHLLIANFHDFNFRQLKDEMKSYQGILWANPTNIIINNGDFVYAYYSHLPDGINRIIFCSVVINNKFKYEENNEKKVGILLSNKKEFRAFNTNDKMKFSTQKLRECGINSFNFGPRHLDSKTLNEKKVKELLKDLDEVYNDNNQVLSLKQLIDGFSDIICFFDNGVYKHNKNNYFEGKNGFRYYEVHHLAQQHLIRKKNMNLYKKI